MYSTATPIALAISATRVPSEDLKNGGCTPTITIHTPQRKAQYHDKNRWRLKPLKAAVLLETGCKSSAEVKKYLKMLGVSLDLRLISAWKAIKFELEKEIVAIKEKETIAVKAVTEALLHDKPLFQIGDPVKLIENSDFPLIESIGGSHTVSKVSGNYIRLAYFSPWIPAPQLVLLDF